MGDAKQAFIDPGLKFAEKAVDADRRAKETGDVALYREAFDAYKRAADYFMVALRHEKVGNLRQIIQNKALEWIDRAEQLQKLLENWKEPPKPSEGSELVEKPPGLEKGAAGPVGASPAGKKGANKKKENDEKQDESKKMRDALSGAIVSEKPNVKWDDVAGLEGAKEALKEAVILPIRFPNLFTGKRKPWRGILMYGPPGTGKSYLAKAVATEADSHFFSISSADLVSKWQGESEKLVRELFKMAREQKPSIIFIDEIDSLASARSDSESESARRIKTEFLVQMQGVGNDTDQVLVLGATNIPWGLDSAIRRRFERRIYIPLPDDRARARMFQIHLGKTPHSLSKADFEELGRLSDGYSGSDISVLVRDAIMQPVRTLQNAQTFKQTNVRDEETGSMSVKWTPCTPADPTARPMKLTDLNPDDLHVPDVSRLDFERALSHSKPSVSAIDIERHVQFTHEFGQEGN
uniref:Vesicle-fusing ATPase n=1 Tax=Compsopogon caeruleus TaxID=31354 RepID=A0A6T6AGU8_9RHOD|mmetsp:Transcript_10796/g.21677  ORF Transcript_10796/g.21677 Transcript_10796/m.21677 type:complete len:466 (+) Transcript_10796:67-1464(+)